MVGHREAVLDGLAIVGVALGVFVWILSLHVAGGQDFVSFYQSGSAWRSGLDPYALGLSQRPNLNPPSIVLLIFAPLSRLPVVWAARLWHIAGLISIVASLRLVASMLHWSSQHTIRAAAILLAGFPAWIIWVEGQTTWLLLYPMTQAWRAWRSDRLLAAGVWLVPVVVSKPTYALMPLALGWSVCLVAGSVSGGLSLLTLAITGWAPWANWLEAGSRASWLPWPTNASLWGVLSRLFGGPRDHVTMDALPRWGLAFIGFAGIILLARWWCSRPADRDARWIAAALWPVLLAPIGWVFFLVWLLGPLGAWLQQRPRWDAILLLGALSLPVTVLAPWADVPRPLFAFGGSLEAWACLRLYGLVTPR